MFRYNTLKYFTFRSRFMYVFPFFVHLIKFYRLQAIIITRMILNHNKDNYIERNGNLYIVITAEKL